MKKLVKIFVSMLCAALLTVPVALTACGSSSNSNGGNGNHVDYVSQVKLDFKSETKKQEVTVKLQVDGDTTHFNPVPNSQIPGCNNAEDFSDEKAPTKGYAKARYLAINTPESTAQIEPYGKAASRFTKEKLANASSIIIESDDDQWNIDSTGTRYLLWVWYMPRGGTEYINLNIEILQNGYAFGSNTSENRYGEVAYAALMQAQEEKLIVFSGEPDPEYYYGGPINVSLKELRFNGAAYEGKKIVVEGTVVSQFDNTSYIEEVYYKDTDGFIVDEVTEEDMQNYEEIRLGMPVYYGFVTGKVVNILSVGNLVSVVGVVEYSSFNECYQITDIKAYDRYDEKNPNNCNLIEEVGLEKAFVDLTPSKLTSSLKSVNAEVTKINEEGEDYTEIVKYSYRDAILNTSVTVANLTVTSVDTTVSDNASSDGAMTLICRAADGTTVNVRTIVFKHEDGTKYTDKDFLNKKITVKGILTKYSGTYQIKCYRLDYITFVG